MARLTAKNCFERRPGPHRPSLRDNQHYDCRQHDGDGDDDAGGAHPGSRSLTRFGHIRSPSIVATFAEAVGVIKTRPLLGQ